MHRRAFADAGITAAAIVCAALALGLILVSPGAARKTPRVVTLARVHGDIAGFAQSARQLVWVSPNCYRVTFRFLASGRQSSAPPAGRRGSCRDDWGGADLVLAGDRVYWTSSVGSTTGEHASLLSASARDPKIRELDAQSAEAGTFDELVPPASDGRSSYFWRASYEEPGPGAIVRYDGRRPRRLLRVASWLRAVAAGAGRLAYATAERTYDCAQDPAWSPDGRSIAYASYERAVVAGARPCRGGLWVMRADGADAQRIGEGRAPDWSPDWTKLSFESPAGALVVANANGSSPRTVVARGGNPAWAPDGKVLAFDREGSTYTVGIDGSGERLLLSAAVQPDWAPDGTRLVVLRTGSTAGLAVVNADGAGLRSLGHPRATEPNWSPNGRAIAFSECLNSHVHCPADDTDVAATAPDGSGFRWLTRGRGDDADLAPSWAPDSRRLAVARQRDWADDGDSHLWTRAPERQVTKTPQPRTPVVLSTRTGREVARFEPRGSVTRLALTAKATAAVVRRGARLQVEILAPRPRLVNLPGSPTRFVGSGRTLVLNVGRAIYVLDAFGGGLRLVARASASPLGLSIVNGRIAWAENRRLGARIRALALR